MKGLLEGFVYTKSKKENRIREIEKRVNRERKHLLDLGAAMEMFFCLLFFLLSRGIHKSSHGCVFLFFPLLFLDPLLSRKTQENFESEEGEKS